MFLFGQLATYVGMFCLALGQRKHARHLMTRLPSDRHRVTAMCLGWSILVFSAGMGVAEYGPGVGTVTFLAWACIGAWAVALLISYKRLNAS